MVESTEELLLNTIYIILAVIFVAIPIISFIGNVGNSEYFKASIYSNAYALALTTLLSYDFNSSILLPSVEDTLIIEDSQLTLEKFKIKKVFYQPTKIQLNKYYEIKTKEFLFNTEMLQTYDPSLKWYVRSICINSKDTSLLKFLQSMLASNVIHYNSYDCEILIEFENESNDVMYSLSNIRNSEIAKAFKEELNLDSSLKIQETPGIRIGIKDINFNKIKEAIINIFSDFLNQNVAVSLQVENLRCDNNLPLKVNLNIINGLLEENEIEGTYQLTGFFFLNKNLDDSEDCLISEVCKFEKHVEEYTDLKEEKVNNNYLFYTLKFDGEYREGNRKLKDTVNFVSECGNYFFVTNNATLFKEFQDRLKNRLQNKGVENPKIFFVDISNEKFVEKCKEYYDEETCDGVKNVFESDYLKYIKDDNSREYNYMKVLYLNEIFLKIIRVFPVANIVLFYDPKKIDKNLEFFSPNLKLTIINAENFNPENEKFESKMNELLMWYDKIIK